MAVVAQVPLGSVAANAGFEVHCHTCAHTFAGSRLVSNRDVILLAFLIVFFGANPSFFPSNGLYLATGFLKFPDEHGFCKFTVNTHCP